MTCLEMVQRTLTQSLLQQHKGGIQHHDILPGFANAAAQVSVK